MVETIDENKVSAAIYGAVIGAIIVVLIFGIILFFLRRRYSGFIGILLIFVFKQFSTV